MNRYGVFEKPTDWKVVIPKRLNSRTIIHTAQLKDRKWVFGYNYGWGICHDHAFGHCAGPQTGKGLLPKFFKSFENELDALKAGLKQAKDDFLSNYRWYKIAEEKQTASILEVLLERLKLSTR